MGKLQDCQFIEIKIDNKAIKGSSTESTYKGWMEGYAPMSVMALASSDGTYFECVDMSIMMTQESSSLYEQYLQRGYKNIVITIVHRGSDEYSPDYEIERVVYTDCKIHSLCIDRREKIFMDLRFTFEGEIDVTLNVPNAEETGLDKIGPIKYNIPTKSLK